MRVLVTGASGFIGSHLTRALVADGYEVHVVGRPGTNWRRLKDVLNRVHILSADLEEGDSLGPQLKESSPDLVFHLAWYAEPGKYLLAERENLISLAAGARLMSLLVESGCPRIVLGGTCLENVITPDLTPYAACKGAQHLAARSLFEGGSSFACAHVFYLYGPEEDERRAIPSVIRSLLRGEKIDVDSGKQDRDYLHVKDVASAIIAVGKSEVQGGFDVCSGSPVPMRSIFELIGEQLGRTELISFGARPDSPNDFFPATGSPDRLNELGWNPEYNLPNGIRNTIDYWRRLETQ